jgi:hypothetical protein
VKWQDAVTAPGVDDGEASDGVDDGEASDGAGSNSSGRTLVYSPEGWTDAPSPCDLVIYGPSTDGPEP